MRVVILNAQVYPFGQNIIGPAKYFYYLGKYLAKEGIEVEFLVSSTEGQKRETYEGITYDFITPYAPHDRESKSALSTYARHRLFDINAVRHLRRKEFDILHTFELAPYWYLRFKRRKAVVMQLWEEAYMKVSYLTASKNIAYRLERKLGSSLSRHLVKYCLTHADAVTFSADISKERIKKLYKIDEDKLLYLPLGVDTSLIQKTVEAGGASRASLGIEDDDFVMIFVGGLIARSNIACLIDALNIIRGQIDKVKLILIGAGPEESRLVAKIRELNLSSNVIRLKNVAEDNLYNYYALSDIYVCPMVEDVHMSIVEAMACGLPVVSSCMDSYVREGLNGYIVPKRSAQAIADAALRLYHSNGGRTLMGEESRNIAREYDWAKIARMAVAGYEKLLSRRS